jgi:hypothetical protein
LNIFLIKTSLKLQNNLKRDFRRDPLGICTPASAQSPFRSSLNSDNLSIESSLTPNSDNSSYNPTRRLSQNDNYDQFESNSYTTLSSPASISSPKRFATAYAYFFILLTTFSKLFIFRKPFWNLKLDTNVLINERSMSLVLPPNQDIEIIRSNFYQKLNVEFEKLLHEYILNLIDQVVLLNKQNEIKNLFNNLTIELKLLNDCQNSYDNIIEPLIISFNKLYEKCDESYLMCYLLKLVKEDIDNKMKLFDDSILENCIQLHKEFINKLLNTQQQQEENR